MLDMRYIGQRLWGVEMGYGGKWDARYELWNA